MTISTNLFYNRATSAMASLSSRTDTLSTQISTGKRLQAPSDDSVAYSRLQTLKVAGADDKAAGTNLAVAASVLAQGDTQLTSMATQLTRASEIATQAASGTYSASDRASFATAIDGIVESLVSLANASDSRGQPLFGDASGGAAVTKNADGSYALSTSTPSAIPIGGGQSVQANESAARVLTANGKNTLDMLTALSAALRSGDDIGTAVDDVKAAGDQVADVQGSLGVRAARVELEQAQLTSAATARETDRSSLEDTDITAAVTELQKTMTVLQATQASFTKLQSLSLFDYLK